MKNAFIFGGCVSRDTRPYLGDQWNMVEYVARQSWISAAAGPATVTGDSALSSSFQNKCLQRDIAGNGFQLITDRRSEIDVLIVDLIVERLGVYRNEEGEILTHSWELERSTLLEQQQRSFQHINFGDDEHFELWKTAAMTLRLLTQDLELPAIILAPAWAARADNGGGGFDYRGTPAAEWNDLYNRYYHYLAEIGFTLIRPPARLVIAKKEHKWGLAAYHYIDKMYAYLAEEIDRAATPPRWYQPI